MFVLWLLERNCCSWEVIGESGVAGRARGLWVAAQCVVLSESLSWLVLRCIGSKVCCSWLVFELFELVVRGELEICDLNSCSIASFDSLSLC